ncbi:hypothetical protein [Streptomyces sp. SD15]
MTEVTRGFRPGDEIRLELPVRPRRIRADPRVDAVRGTVAVQRGPLVYCAESVDLPDGHEVDVIRVDLSVAPEDGPDGTVVTAGQITAYDVQRDETWPYRPLDRAAVPPSADRTGIDLVPYHSWANRGPSTVRVWLPAVDPDEYAGPGTFEVKGSVAGSSHRAMTTVTAAP